MYLYPGLVVLVSAILFASIAVLPAVFKSSDYDSLVLKEE